MTFELAVLVVMLALFGLAVAHAFTTRPRSEAVFLLVTGVCFGYAFPFLDVNVFRQYAFHGDLTVAGLPAQLGLAWFALYYLSLGVAEILVGRGASDARVAVVAGVVFGLLEAQWDPALLADGMMELLVPSFAPWPLGFNPGVPLTHVLFGFGWVYGYRVMRTTPRQGLAIAVTWAFLVAFPLGIMACVPLVEPIYAWGAGWMPRWLAYTVDVVHFLTTFVPAIWVASVCLRWLARRLGATPVAAERTETPA